MAERRAEAIPREPVRRLFFALWPDQAMREAMAHATHKAARRSGGRPVAEANLHVTLAFLGPVPERRLGELAEIARGAGRLCAGAVAPSDEESRLELAFEHLEHWRTAQLLCALPAEPPARLLALARRLQELLLERGFSPDLKPFRPHVTVVRKVSRAERIAAMHPVRWRFAELALIESRTLPEGPLYSVVESFPLCRGAPRSTGEPGRTNAANNTRSC